MDRFLTILVPIEKSLQGLSIGAGFVKNPPVSTKLWTNKVWVLIRVKIYLLYSRITLIPGVPESIKVIRGLKIPQIQHLESRHRGSLTLKLHNFLYITPFITRRVPIESSEWDLSIETCFIANWQLEWWLLRQKQKIPVEFKASIRHPTDHFDTKKHHLVSKWSVGRYQSDPRV